MVFVALQVDALGNYFRLYRPDVTPIRYDEFAHLVVQALIMPMIIWVAQRLLLRDAGSRPVARSLDGR